MDDTSDPLFKVLFEMAPNALLVTDRAGRIVRVNGQGREMFGYDPEELIGQPVEILIPARYRQSHQESREVYNEKPSMRNIGEGRDLYALRKDGREFPVEVALKPFQVGEEPLVLAEVVDISVRKAMEDEQARLLDQLKKALDQVQVLHGLLPICSYCKKIRNDQGYWEQIEGYVSAHSPVTFTHSICPECRARMEL